jgi:hypothetical protein
VLVSISTVRDTPSAFGPGVQTSWAGLEAVALSKTPAASPQILIDRILISHDAPLATGNCDARSGMSSIHEQGIVATLESKGKQ